MAYTGGAGPTFNKARNNNLALLRWAREQGHWVILIRTPFTDEREDTDPGCVKFVRYNFNVGYDRWGFMFDGQLDEEGENKDQVSWEETVVYINKLTKKKSCRSNKK